MSITIKWDSNVRPAWVNYKPWCFYRNVLINWWSVAKRKSRVLRRLQFYPDFEILSFKQLCYSLQSHGPHLVDSVSLVHLKAEHEYSTEFSLFVMNISHNSELEYFYSSWYVSLFLWCTHHSVFIVSSAGGGIILKRGLKIYIHFNF